uniref:Uncharacterized protein n=1 Tax=uncultured prokaryote TaxID=198431 RepID=A0A0H5Q2G1_9ZZZZ|nr:hypothetical protein [uncultured prokaryote]
MQCVVLRERVCFDAVLLAAEILESSPTGGYWIARDPVYE